MKECDKWRKTLIDNDKYAYRHCSEYCIEVAFKAGMLAAADMVHGIPTLEAQIRKAADET